MALYGPLKSRSFSTLTKNLYPGLTMIVRRLDIQIPPCDLYSELADLLAHRLPYLLPVAGLREHGGILPLANLDSRSK